MERLCKHNQTLPFTCTGRCGAVHFAAEGTRWATLLFASRLITYQGWRARSGQRRGAQGVLVSPHDPAVNRTVRERPFAQHRPCHVAGIASRRSPTYAFPRKARRAGKYGLSKGPVLPVSRSLACAYARAFRPCGPGQARCVCGQGSEAALYRPQRPGPHRGGAPTVRAGATGHAPGRYCWAAVANPRPLPAPTRRPRPAARKRAHLPVGDGGEDLAGSLQ